MEKYQEFDNVSNEVSEDNNFQTLKDGEILVRITEGEILDFTGDKTLKYLNKFKKFHADAHDKFALTWHWPAFFFGPIWMSYRKLYGWASAVFFLGLFFPPINLIISVALGLSGNYLYYKHTKKRIINLKSSQKSSDSTQMTTALKKIGGTNKWAAIIVVFLAVAALVFFLLFNLSNEAYKNNF